VGLGGRGQETGLLSLDRGQPVPHIVEPTIAMRMGRILRKRRRHTHIDSSVKSSLRKWAVVAYPL
jgi:hypothetical protein